MKKPLLAGLCVLVVLIVLGVYLFTGSPEAPAYTTAKAARHDIRVVVSTNGIIEPAERSEVYAAIDGFVTSLPHRVGSEISQGQLLMQLNSEQLRTALAGASAALLSARRQAHVVETGPSKEEIAALDASIAETALQLKQQSSDLAAEEALYKKSATTRIAVENLRKQRDLTQLRAESLKQKREELLARYSAEDKEWELGRIGELTKEVESIKRQLSAESVVAPKSGRVYSLQVKQGSFVNKGQLLAQIYRPGGVLLRAYVDEPDLGRVRKGQQVRIEWDGLPNQHWTGTVERQAEQVVAMNNRSIGEVLCTIDSGPEGLIPNLNVRVEITTNRKENALVVPRSAVINRNGKPAVMVLEGINAVAKQVEVGLVTPEEIEIVQGINSGESVVLNPAEGTKK